MSSNIEKNSPTYIEAVRDESLAIGKVTFQDGQQGRLVYKTYRDSGINGIRGVLSPKDIEEQSKIKGRQVSCNMRFDYYLLKHEEFAKNLDPYNILVFNVPHEVEENIRNGGFIHKSLGCDFYNGDTTTLSLSGEPVTFSGNIIINDTTTISRHNYLGFNDEFIVAIGDTGITPETECKSHCDFNLGFTPSTIVAQLMAGICAFIAGFGIGLLMTYLKKQRVKKALQDYAEENKEK